MTRYQWSLKLQASTTWQLFNWAFLSDKCFARKCRKRRQPNSDQLGKEKNRREVSARESETAIKKREPRKPERRQVRVNPTKVAGKRPEQRQFVFDTSQVLHWCLPLHFQLWDCNQAGYKFQDSLMIEEYRAQIKSELQVWWILLLLLLITSSPACLQHSGNLVHRL